MKRIVLIGAGSLQFGYQTLGEIFASEVLRESTVVLLDIDADALARVEKAARNFIAEHNLPTRLEATTEREQALASADFVVISIEVGDRFALWDQDRTLAQQFGVPQVFGENGGPGGLFHSLRILPPILEICADVERLCPAAWVFCYSNPMTRICTTVARAYPELKFVGLCHEVSSLERYLPSLLDTPFANLELVAGGLNHFSCLLQARYRDSGRDAYPDIRAKAPAFFAELPGASDFLQTYRQTGKLYHTEGVTEMVAASGSARNWVERRMFAFMLEAYDLLPITTDSHIGEYPVWAHDVVDHQGIVDFYHYYQICLSQGEPLIKMETHERVVPIMQALTTGEELLEAAVNLPNRGYIAELPEDIVVEVPARIGSAGVEGQNPGPIPAGFAALLANQVGVLRMTAEAILTRSKKAALQALLADPVMTRAGQASQLLEVMLDRQRAYLGYLS